jgi:hypothetical protein
MKVGGVLTRDQGVIAFASRDPRELERSDLDGAISSLAKLPTG